MNEPSLGRCDSSTLPPSGSTPHCARHDGGERAYIKHSCDIHAPLTDLGLNGSPQQRLEERYICSFHHQQSNRLQVKNYPLQVSRGRETPDVCASDDHLSYNRFQKGGFWFSREPFSEYFLK